MSADDVTPAGQPEPGDVTPGDQPPDPFDLANQANYADDWQGDISTDLTPEEEARRDDTYKHVQRLAGEYGIPCFPVWQANEDGSCSCPEGAGCERAGKHPSTLPGTRWPPLMPSRRARWWRPLGKDEEKVDWRPKANVGELMGERHFLLDVDMGEGQQGDLYAGRADQPPRRRGHPVHADVRHGRRRPSVRVPPPRGNRGQELGLRSGQQPRHQGPPRIRHRAAQPVGQGPVPRSRERAARAPARMADPVAGRAAGEAHQAPGGPARKATTTARCPSSCRHGPRGTSTGRCAVPSRR